ncbi:MAG: hypothetical protein ACI9N9_002080 [Enterobacterales bacterium]|jgi:hypothetical protein
MSPDIQFIINCCKTNPATANIDNIRTSITQLETEQLSNISKLAHEHGVFPLYHQAIQTYASDLISDDILEKLKEQNLLIVMQNMRMSNELTIAMKLIEESGIHALSFKGPVLAQWVYGSIALRQYGDLDLLVDKADVLRVEAVLTENGFKRVTELTPSQESAWFKYAYDIKLIEPNSGIIFEIHWSLIQQDYPIQLSLDILFENPKYVKINNQDIPTFQTEELLIYLCVHGSKHLWERIEWIKDIDLLIQTQIIDWNKVEHKTKGSDIDTMFYLGIYLTCVLFETEIPNSIYTYSRENKRLEKLANLIFKHWQTSNSANISITIQRAAAMLMLFPSLSMKSRYLYKIIIKPSFNEYQYIELPDPLYWLYYFIRPYLLLKKYFSHS